MLGYRSRLYHSGEASGRDATVGLGFRSPGREGWPPPRCTQRGVHTPALAGCGSGDLHAPSCQEDLLHPLDEGRQDADVAHEFHPKGVFLRARRQCPIHHLR